MEKLCFKNKWSQILLLTISNCDFLNKEINK